MIASLLSLAIAAAPVNCDPLWELTQRLDRKVDICLLEKSALEKKLLVATSSVIVHKDVIIQERKLTTLEEIMEWVGVAAVFGLGVSAGWLFFH
jgi:hypothetical protein